MPANDPLNDGEVLELVHNNLCPRCGVEVSVTYPTPEATPNTTLYACTACGWTEQNTAERLSA